MKQHTTQTKTLRVPGQESLLMIADRLVVAISHNGTVITYEGDRLTVDGDAVTWSMTTAETAKLVGRSAVELTIFVGDEVHKTKTTEMIVEPSVWDNGEADA